MKRTLTHTRRPRKSTTSKTRDAIQIIDRMVGDDDALRALVEEASLNARVAQIIYDARNRAGLTQKQLADKIGSAQSVIARLEDADYRGHSLSMLQRIAAALDCRIELKLAPARPARSSKRSLRPAGR